MNTEIINEKLTFDELFEGEYYKKEFDKQVQERLKEQNEQTCKLMDFRYKVQAV